MWLTQQRLGPRSPMSAGHANAPRQSKALGGGQDRTLFYVKTLPLPGKWCHVRPPSVSLPEPQGSRILRIWAVVLAPSTLARSLPLVKPLRTQPLCQG